MSRIEKDFYYLKMAETAASRSTCITRRYGAVIVKDDVIISTGYNGAPRGRKNCSDIGYCYRKAHNIKRGTQYEKCRSSHAEMNAIISASRDAMLNSTMYLYGEEVDTGEPVKDVNCCSICRRLIINAGIAQVVFADKDKGVGSDHAPYRAKTIKVQEWIDNDDSLDEGEGY